MIGKTLGHYQITSQLGKGGMGEVYQAKDSKLGRDVAIKVLPESFADATARARLLREARAAAALNHPHICTIYEVGEAEGQAYISMEHLDGQPLSALVLRGPLQEDQVLRYGLQLADALEHAHARGVIHRDLKSSNVMITPEGRAKVLDFGLAKRGSGEELAEAVTRSQETLTAFGALVGTVPYMAPEQLRGQPADARSDIWALGVVLYEMAASRRPFQGQTGFELSSAILNQPPAPLAVSPVLQAVVERCLAKEPGQRYQRGGEVRAALEAVQTGTAPLPPRLARRHWLALAAAAVVVLLLVVLALFRQRLGGGSRIESLAVLPLENLSGDQAQEYFADGMTEELITGLAQLKGLKRVIARGSVMGYKTAKKSFPQIAQELHVDALVTGTVLRAGDRVRITAQLINPATGAQLWAERYEGDRRDVLTLQNEVSRAIADKIQVKLSPGEKSRLAAARPVNPEAYEDYLKGQVHLWKLTPQGMGTAMEYFQLALQKDPNYALAHLGIAMVWAARSNILDLPPGEGFPKLKSAALRVLELDTTLAEAHSALGTVLAWYEWDWPAAEREFRRAIELNPNYADVHRLYFFHLLSIGRPEQAVAEIRRALELDPQSSLYQHAFGWALLALGRDDEAYVHYQKLLKTDPDYFLTHWTLWITLHRKGRYAEAIAEARKFYAGRGDPETAEALANGFAEGGYQRAMRLAAERLATRFKHRYVHPAAVAQLYAYAGEKGQALDWLEKAFEERDPQGMYLHWYPGWVSLRGDPRFQALLRKMNLPVN